MSEELQRNQPCGCIICVCEDTEQCHGCGAKHCGTHPLGEIPNPAYTPMTPHALTREQCSLCTANRPRLCDQHYKQGADELLKHVTAAIQDQQTPGGVKATYEQLLELCNQQRQALAQQAQEIERLNKLIKERNYRDEANATFQLQLFADKAKRIDDLKQQLAASQARVRELEVTKDGAYLERNHLVAALARCFPSGIRKTAIEGWSDDWHGCVYIDLPAGQISYHYHDSQAFLFESLPAYGKPYDGHTKDDVHDRLKSAQLQATIAEQQKQTQRYKQFVEWASTADSEVWAFQIREKAQRVLQDLE